MLNFQLCYKCAIQEIFIFYYYTAEKRTSMWGIMGSFHKHNRLNLGQCSKA